MVTDIYSTHSWYFIFIFFPAQSYFVSTMIMLRILASSALVIGVHSYCAGIGSNPGWSAEPRVEQLSLTAVLVSWEGLLTRGECADQLIVKHFATRNPNDYTMSDLLNVSTTSYVVEYLRTGVDYIFQTVAREDLGILGKEWNKSPKAYFRLSESWKSFESLSTPIMTSTLEGEGKRFFNMAFVRNQKL